MIRSSVRAAAIVASLASVPVGAQEVLAPPAAIVAPVAAVVLPDEAEPELPKGAAPGFEPPAVDGAGGYLTPNRGLSGEETTWHLRVALNVAALGCRGALVDGYNALLTTHKVALAATAEAVTMRYKARFGQGWQAQQDDAMTRLYNFWALPPAQVAFCAAASGVLAEATTVAPDALPGFAAAALPRIEAPLIAFFAEYDRWRTAHAGWAARHTRAPAAMIAVAAVTRVRIGAGEP
jgi:hypothetical protein